ncbi:MAG TPA: glycosyltransferase family 4 protein [Actinomycetota bacterium]|nr:glycosyltransferase family 4 protein [Actinomycetota bacterium]
MRILVLSNMFPPHHIGGYELSCKDVMDRLRARGHEITVLTTTMRIAGVDDPPDERAHGILRDLSFYWDDHRLVSPPFRERLARERANQRALLDALERSRPDVVSVWNMGAMSLGLLATLVERDVPLVFAVCDDWLVYGPKLDAWTRLFKWSKSAARVARSLFGVPTAMPDLTDAGTFCFVTDFVRRRARDKARLDARHSTVVYSGIDRADFPSVASEAKPWRGRLLCVGRVNELKGVDVAIEALAHLPADTSLDILGRVDPAYRARLDEIIRRHGLAERVRFDVVERSELPARYRAADALLFPVRWEEPFGLVPIEAMVCGTPVVATGLGGSAEFLADETNCLLVPPNDPAAVAAAVTRLAGDEALRARLVAGGEPLAEELTTDHLADAFEVWHQAAVEHFANGAPPDRKLPVALGRDGKDETRL